MQIAEILEAKLYNRNWVDEAKHIIADDKEDRLQRVSMDDAKEISQQFHEEFGDPQHIEEDNGGIGVWQYQWEQHHEVDGKWQRWFIKVGWYVPSKRGIVKVTRHRKYTDVKEAKHHQQEDVLRCPKCRGSGKGKKQRLCWTCDGKKFVPKSQVPFGGAHDVIEAKYHQQKEMVTCPECLGKGGKKYPHHGEYEYDSCWTCHGKKVISKRKNSTVRSSGFYK